MRLNDNATITKACAASSWSGGKDSCLACYKALAQGYEIKYLVNFISREFKRCCFHGIEARLIKVQAELIGIPLIQKEVTQDMKEYEKEFKEALSGLKGIDSMVFGDIYLDEHKDWVERVCSDLGIAAVEPLWNSSTERLIEEFIDLGFKAIVVSCQADKFNSDFVGSFIDKALLADLKSRDICPCGENGEFHTLVLDGPIFKKRIEILEGAAVLKEGFWKYWFLDIKRFAIKDK
jgi:diphthine-ammonia ligase